MGGDQPDWTEMGRVPTAGNRNRGPDARAPDWQADPAKYAAKLEREKRERGELLVAVGPYCVPCGKRFAKQTVYDAHLSGKKHLAALQRMGRYEEAMVCQLDVEAKRRRVEIAEELKASTSTTAGSAGASSSGGWAEVTPTTASEVDGAARRATEREEKLRRRAMLPMPVTVAAGSVHALAEDDPTAGCNEDGAQGAAIGAAQTLDGADRRRNAASTAVQLRMAPSHEASTLELASAASGAGARFSYTSGRQDALCGSVGANRHTTEQVAAQHRRLAQPGDDWFCPRPRE